MGVKTMTARHHKQLEERKGAALDINVMEMPTQSTTPINGKGVGRQLIMECWECNDKIYSREAIEEALREAVRRANATLLATYVHEFEPYGVSAVAVIAESHIFIHTWPEMGYIAFDAFTCGDHAIPEEAARVIKEVFQPRRVKTYELLRGHWP